MSTKNNPGPFDCYAKAAPDEPMFVLLARDPLAPDLVREWTKLRAAEVRTAIEGASAIEQWRFATDKIWHLNRDDQKIYEALECARAMEKWRIANQPKTKP